MNSFFFTQAKQAGNVFYISFCNTYKCEIKYVLLDNSQVMRTSHKMYKLMTEDEIKLSW